MGKALLMAYPWGSNGMQRAASRNKGQHKGGVTSRNKAAQGSTRVATEFAPSMTARNILDCPLWGIK